MRNSLHGLLLLSMVACLTPSGARVPAAHSNATAAVPAASGLGGKSDLMLFLLIGQSNMVGAPKPEARDEVQNPRVFVLAYDDCPNLGRAYNQLVRAARPLRASPTNQVVATSPNFDRG
jgi:hypothetical protein